MDRHASAQPASKDGGGGGCRRRGRHKLTSPWFIRLNPQAHPRWRLFCIPYAGAGASAFRAWARATPPDVDLWAVQLPGRETRLREPLCRSVAAVVEPLCAAMTECGDLPFALYGHSNGALVAFEVFRRQRVRGLVQARALVVSGAAAPDCPLHRPPIHTLPDDEFVRRVGLLDGTKREVLESREMMQLLMPVLRADIGMNETYEFTAAEPLECPILALGALSDPEATQQEVAAWQRHTRGEFESRFFRGGHFFIYGSDDVFGGMMTWLAPRMAVPQRDFAHR